MFQIGDWVVYGSHGVCRITACQERTVDRKKRGYWVLEPIHQDGVQYFLPQDNPSVLAKLRKVLKKEAIHQLLCSDLTHQDCWIDEESQRKNAYRERLGSGDYQSVLQIYFTLSARKQRLSAEGKRLHISDEGLMRDAEKMLIGELSLVLELTPENTKTILLKAIRSE